jgi:immune inhibitor A
MVVEEPTPELVLVRHAPSLEESETARILDRTSIPERDLHDLARRLQLIPSVQATPSPATPSDYALGDELTFWVHDVESNSFFTSTAILRYETPHAYWWIEEGYEVESSDLARSAERFEDQTYPISHRYFGSEWSPGVDGDPHIYIFLGDVPGVGGYFSGPDEYTTLVRPNSNEHEMFYINLENAVPGNDYFDGILAHEFQHMIHWFQDRNEDTWVNEGLSELAAHVAGYEVGGSDYAYSLTPDTQLNAWTDLGASAPHYGASYLFLAYFLEQYGEEAVRQLVNEQDNGIAGFNDVLAELGGRHDEFNDLFADWVVANYLDSPRPAAGRYGYPALRIEPPRYAARHIAFPVHREATIHQYAADYILLEGEGDLTIEFEGSTAVSLLGNEVRGGKYQWWSNRGDDGDATLTRAFDLSDLERATLKAWMWYDLEDDYDYSYVEVSEDGGSTWDILANSHTTLTNPSGNNYGPALTGVSGGEDGPSWVLETFDLTPYAGKEVLLRFEVITDEALNRPGLALDDISIPELGYSHDAENSDGGWEAEGWLRLGDSVPQDFLVQLVTIGSRTQIRRMVLNDQNRGTMTAPRLGQEADSAVLIVSALAPVTTERTSYSYSVTRK